MEMTPTQISISGDNRLQITWSDAQLRVYTFRELRDACPCATCKEKRAHPAPVNPLQVLSAAETRPVLIRGMTPVGNYAYSIDFSDGHDTGIFTIEYLRKLGRVV